MIRSILKRHLAQMSNKELAEFLLNCVGLDRMSNIMEDMKSTEESRKSDKQKVQILQVNKKTGMTREFVCSDSPDLLISTLNSRANKGYYYIRGDKQ